MERQPIGIANLTALATVLAAAANLVGAVLDDSKVNLKDLPHVGDALSVVGQLAKVDFDQIESEAKDLTGEEQDQLAAHFKTVFDLENDDREALIEEGLGYLIKGYEAIKVVIELTKKIKS